VIADKTAVSSQYYSQLQTFAVVQLSLVVVPVSDCSEAVGFLLQLVKSLLFSVLLLLFAAFVHLALPQHIVTRARCYNSTLLQSL